MDAQERILELRKEIDFHRKLYYVEDNPQIEDYQYDALFRELEGLEAEHPELITPESPTQRVGGVSEKFNQVAHKNRLYSLLERAFPRIDEFFGSPAKANGHQKLIDFVIEFWHNDCVSSLSLSKLCLHENACSGCG